MMFQETPGHNRQTGMTLIEIMIGSVLMIAIAYAAIVTLGSSMDLFEQSSTSNNTSRFSQRACNRIADILTHAGEETIAETLDGPSGSTRISFRKKLGYLAGEHYWGPIQTLALQPDPKDPVDGKDNDQDGLIDDCMVVLTRDLGLATQNSTVLVGNVSRYLEGESRNNQDDNGNGLKDEGGFCIVRQDNSLIIRLTVLGRDSERRLSRNTSQTSIVIRN